MASLGIFLLFVVIAILVMGKKSNSETIIQKASEIVASPAPAESIAEKKKEQYKWAVYEGKTYTFQYPPDWVITTTSVVGGGEVVTARPAALPAGINYPLFVLQTQPAAADGYAMKEGVLLGLGFTQTNEKLEATESKKFVGTIPFKSVGNKTVQEPLQDTTYLINTDESIYLLKYEYEGGSQNELLEDFFYGFVHSFKLK